MNRLIVDDEMIAIEGIRANTDWEKLHFENIYTANSYAQAVELVAKNRVDVMLCDIEMPGESGLELIRWMNDNSPDTVNIILTCHEDFQFAKRAVALSCMDYILKPATPAVLMDVLGRAEKKAAARSEEKRYHSYGEQYVQSLADREEGGKPDGQHGGEESENAVEQIKQYIAGHVSEELSVEDLAAMVHFNPDYLSRVFKKETGKTVSEYITEYRCALAGELLKNTDLSVTMIASKSGYPNYAYFTRIFKKYSGCTPREYRKKSDLCKKEKGFV